MSKWTSILSLYLMRRAEATTLRLLIAVIAAGVAAN